MLSLVDWRLRALLDDSASSARLALNLALLQRDISTTTRHQLSYADEYVWRRLLSCRFEDECIRSGELPLRLNVRCLVCPAVASLRDWQLSLRLSTLQRKLRIKQCVTMGIAPERTTFLAMCEGQRLAQALIVELEKYTKE